MKNIFFFFPQSFDTITWATILGIIITTPILLSLIRLKNGQGTILPLFVDSFLDVWGIFCQQGLYGMKKYMYLFINNVKIMLKFFFFRISKRGIIKSCSCFNFFNSNCCVSSLFSLFN